LQHPGQKESGYYSIPGPYLGFKLDDLPKVYLHRVDIPEDVMFNKVSMSDPDTLTWEQAMSEPPENIEKWLDSAGKEMKALEGTETWEEVPLSTSTVKVIPGTWVFQRKRDPQGNVTKWKACWVLRGDLQDVDFDTYASVVSWPAVRIFLVLSLLLGWDTKALDFDNVFVQAKIDHNIFAYLPRGYYSMLKTLDGDKKVALRLKKSLYGISVAPKLWYDHLLKGLKELGFKPSSYDKYMLYKDDMIIITFVDDCGLLQGRLVYR
jgi:hypothetical protein